MRYTLSYLNYCGITKFMNIKLPVRENMDFKTLKEARNYLSLLSEDEGAYIYDNVTKKIVKPLNKLREE